MIYALFAFFPYLFQCHDGFKKMCILKLEHLQALTAHTPQSRVKSIWIKLRVSVNSDNDQVSRSTEIWSEKCLWDS